MGTLSRFKRWVGIASDDADAYVCRSCGSSFEVEYHVCPDCGGFSVQWQPEEAETAR